MADTFGPSTSASKASRLASLFHEAELLIGALATPEVAAFVPAKFRPVVGFMAWLSGNLHALHSTADVIRTSTDEPLSEQHTQAAQAVVGLSDRAKQHEPHAADSEPVAQDDSVVAQDASVGAGDSDSEPVAQE